MTFAASAQDTIPLKAPPEYCCPISQDIMTDPVIAADGNTYERSYIQDWFTRGKRTSPLTNLPLTSTVLIPNIVLKKLIQDYLAYHRGLQREGQERQDHASALAAVSIATSLAAAPVVAIAPIPPVLVK